MESEEQNNQSGVMSVKQWLGTLALLMIPIVNIVLLFIWAFDGKTSPNKSNYAKATLILAAIIIGIEIIFFILIFALFASAVSSDFVQATHSNF
jgi:membrane protein YdbS with pleckstrin-like domain